MDQQWPKLGEADYTPFINAQMAKKPEAVFSSLWGGHFVTFAKQAKPLGYFDAVKYNFIGVGEAGSPESTKAMGDDYPVGIWGNSYDAFYWTESPPAHREYVAKVSKYLKDEYPSSWAIQGYIGMQFLVAEAIKKAGSTDSDKVAKALLGLSIDTPLGKLTHPGEGSPGQPRPALRQDRDGPEVPLRDHEAGGVRRPRQVHGLAWMTRRGASPPFRTCTRQARLAPTADRGQA